MGEYSYYLDIRTVYADARGSHLQGWTWNLHTMICDPGVIENPLISQVVENEQEIEQAESWVFLLSWHTEVYTQTQEESFTKMSLLYKYGYTNL